MSAKPAAPQPGKVLFHFLGFNEDSHLPGTVLLRDGVMVLDIPGGCGPYLIKGKTRGHAFEGTNENSNRGKARVEAKWADVGGIYVGRWIEDDYEYLFSFELDSTK